MSGRLQLVLATAVVAVLLAGAGLWWFFRGDAPAEVSLEDAVESVTGDEAPATTTAGGVEGAWTVDTTTGGFDHETATGTFAGFRVDEELSGIGSATAVGRTGDVTGSATIEGTTVTAAAFEVDLTTITTNDSRRDDAVQRALETATYPTATFALAEPIELGEAAASGDPVSVVAPGDLTVHGVTRQVEIPIDAQLVEGTIVLVGSLDLALADYGIEAPTSPIVLSVDDRAVLELQLLLARR